MHDTHLSLVGVGRNDKLKPRRWREGRKDFELWEVAAMSTGDRNPVSSTVAGDFPSLQGSQVIADLEQGLFFVPMGKPVRATCSRSFAQQLWSCPRRADPGPRGSWHPCYLPQPHNQLTPALPTPAPRSLKYPLGSLTLAHSAFTGNPLPTSLGSFLLGPVSGSPCLLS